MKRMICTTAVTLIMTGIYAQNPAIDRVLESIEINNKELQAGKQSVRSQKYEAIADNNLPDPTFSYAHMWGKHNKNESISELVVSQSFDFPTLYPERNKLNKLKMNLLDSRADLLRQDVLLQAKELCLDLIMLNKQKQLLDERLKNAAELSELYKIRLEAGDATILETNKLTLELLNVKTESTMNNTELQNKLRELTALNGDIPVGFEATEYPPVIFPGNFQQLKQEVVSSDIRLRSVMQEASVAFQQVAVNKSQWLPRLEVGYRRNTEAGNPFNGMVVGFSVPLFENRNKVKMAKAQNLNLTYQQENTAIGVESELVRLYGEAEAAKRSMEDYEKVFAAQSDLDLLKMALTGGEISMIEYFVEVSGLYQSMLNYLQLQNQYQKAMARIYKNSL